MFDKTLIENFIFSLKKSLTLELRESFVSAMQTKTLDDGTIVYHCIHCNDDYCCADPQSLAEIVHNESCPLEVTKRNLEGLKAQSNQ